MKRILFFISVVLFLSGCSLYQEVTFKEDGKVFYLMSIDAGQIMGMGLSANDIGEMPSDTVISIIDMLKEKKNMDSISETEKRLYQDIAPLSVRIKSDINKKELFISYFGDFKNITALNKALQAMSLLDSIDSKKEGSNSSKQEQELNKIIERYNLYTWDGKTMTAVNQHNPDKKDNMDANDEDELSKLSSLSGMFSGGKMKTKYTFPKKVKTVNNPDALLSADRKSVIIEYQASDFLDNPKLSDIVIELE